MKKLLLLLSLAIPALQSNAEVLFADSFAYSFGNLQSQGMWVTSGYAGSNPINIIDDNLTYTGYQDEVSGHAVRIDMSMGKNAAQRIFSPLGSDAVDGTIYYSALVRVDEFPEASGKPGAILSLTGVNAASGEYGDALTGSEGAGLYVKKGSDSAHALFGISRRSSSNGVNDTDVAWTNTQVSVGATALIVVSYTPGANGSTMRMWINPTATSADAPDAIQAATADAEATLIDVRGLQIAQRSALTSKMPMTTIDEVRVATTFDEIFSGQEPPKVVPNISLSQNPIDFGQVYCGIPYTEQVIVKATDLSEDITLTYGESGLVTASATTIPAEEAMSEQGYELSFTLVAEEGRYYSERITLSSAGAQDKVLILNWHSVPSLVANTIRELCDENSHDMVSVYVYTGQATVTFVESYYDLSYERVVNSIFAQDATGGVELRSATGCGYEEVDISNVRIGDNITNIAGYLIFGDSGLTMVPRTADAYEVVSHDNPVEPIEVTLRDLATAPDGYEFGNQLVRVRNVTFKEDYFLQGDYFGLWNSAKYEIYDGTLDDYEAYAWMWCNKGADYFKQSTEGYFSSKWTLTGFINSYFPIHISPRGFSDFEYEGVAPFAGVEDITADPEVSAIFDLQGRMVTGTPAPGFYIVRFKDGRTMRCKF